jgi:hypothetical protein
VSAADEKSEGIPVPATHEDRATRIKVLFG